MSSAESATRPDAKSDLSPDESKKSGKMAQQKKSSSARRRARRGKSRKGHIRHGKGRAWEELAIVLRRTRETYLGKDRPWKIAWPWRFLNALLGIIALGTVGVSKILTAELERISELISELTPILEESGKENNQDITLDREFIYSRLELLGTTDEGLPVVYGLLSVALAVMIASGIRHGGPLRLFFLGVTIPGLVILAGNRVF